MKRAHGNFGSGCCRARLTNQNGGMEPGTRSRKSVPSNVLVLVGALALALSIVLAPAAGAVQEGDPYGPTSSSVPPEGADPSCEVASAEATVGTTVRGTVRDVVPGSTIRLFLGSTEVAEVTAPAAPSGVRRLPAQVGATVDVDFSFEVPDLAPGEYELTATGSTFTATCINPLGGDTFGVLAAAIADDDGGDDGDLAFTGLELLTMVLVALAAIAGGWVLWSRSRARLS